MNKKLYIKGKISKINKNFFVVITSDNKMGVVYINDISDYYIKNLSTVFEIGEELELLVKYIKDDIYFCDFKSGKPDFLNFPFEYEINETKSGFNNLLEYNKKEVLKWKKLN
ncbi:MAG: hypothetical protein ACRC1F_01205 [Metamycoplasmataceae bacterium]